MKKLFSLAISVLFCGSVLYAGEALKDGVHAAGSSAQGIQVQGGAIKPWTASTLDLGSTALPFKDLNMSGTGSIAGSMRIQTFLGFGTADVVFVASGTTVVPTSSFISLISTGSIIMHSTAAEPQISTSVNDLGDFLVVTTTESHSFTFSEGGVSDIIGGTLVISQYDVLYFVLSSSDTTDSEARYWLQIGYQNN